MNSRLSLLSGLVACMLVLGACNRQGPDVPKGVDDNTSVDDYGDGINPVAVSPDAAKVGSEADDMGDIPTEVREFDVGQTIYISVPTKFGRKVGDRLEIFWFHDDGRSRKDDTKKIEGEFTLFEFIANDAGPYNVEVAANGRPIALVQFTVK